MNKKIILLYSSLLTFLIVPGCGLWSDFSTYFNVYYNTIQEFEKVELAIKEQKKGIFSQEELPLPGNSAISINKVIEKSSKILQFHANSSFVDEALLIIGKSFFYQKSYSKALRKFNELLSTQPESDLVLETELWAAKTYMKLHNYSQGLALIDSTIAHANAEGEEEIVAEAYVEIIKHRLFQDQTEAAIDLMHKYLEISDNDVLNAEVVYELGKLYIKNKRYTEAVETLEKVDDYEPTFDIEYDSRLELGRTLRILGNDNLALEVFEDLRDENKYIEKKDYPELEIAMTYIEMKKTDEANLLLTKVDTTYPASPVSGIAKLKKAEIYDYDYMNFDSAASYYTKAASSNAPEQYIKIARQKDELFKKYRVISNAIHDYERQLVYKSDSLAFVNDSITYARTIDSINRENKIQDSLRNLAVKNGTQMNQQLQQGNQFNMNSLIQPRRPVLGEDSLKSLLAKNKLELGNLFLTEFDIPDSAYYYYSNILEQYPNTTLKSRTLFALGSYYLTVDDKPKSDSIFNYIYDNYKNDPIINAVAKKLNKPEVDLTLDPANDLFIKAEKEYLNKNYSTAIPEFYNIYLQYPASALSPKALYTAGFILENELNLLDSAGAVYDTLLTRYPSNQYTQAIMQKLLAYRNDQYAKKVAIEDSIRKEKAKSDSSTMKKEIPANNKPEVQDTDDDQKRQDLRRQQEEEELRQQEELRQKEEQREPVDSSNVNNPNRGKSLSSQISMKTILKDYETTSTSGPDRRR